METLNFKKTCRRILSNAAVLLSAAGLCIAVPQGCTDLGTETSSRSHEGISGNAGEKVRVIFKPYIEYPETKAADNSVRNIIVAVYGGGTLVESLDLDSGAEASVELSCRIENGYLTAEAVAAPGPLAGTLALTAVQSAVAALADFLAATAVVSASLNGEKSAQRR